MLYNILKSEEYISDIKRAAEIGVPWENLNSKTLLITGATGMIASVIIDIIMYKNETTFFDSKKISVIAISRDEEKAKKRFAAYWDSPFFTYISHDITTQMPTVGNVDYVFHAASNTHPIAYAKDPIGTIAANVQGTYYLLEYAINHQCERFLFFSSVEIYGENKSGADKFGENDFGYIDCNTTRACYSESKRLGEALCNAFAAQKGQDFVIGRFSRVYGPTMSQNDSKAIAQFIKKAVLGKDIVLKSEGNQLYSYTYVVDAATAALFLLLKGDSGSAVNVVDSASDIMLKDLAMLLAKEAGTKVVHEIPDDMEKSGYSIATKAVLDGTKIERLGWEAYTHIEQGIKKTVQTLKQVEENQG